MVGAQMPLFTGGRLAAEEDIARANLEEARARMDLATELTEFDTAEAYERLRAAEARLRASSGTVGTAVRAYQIAEIRYREGISTQLELTDTRLQLQQAEVNRARSTRDVRVAETRIALLPYLPLSNQPSAAPSAPNPSIPPELQVPSPSIPAGAAPLATSATANRSNRTQR
jgi:outer membrane protein TolC